MKRSGYLQQRDARTQVLLDVMQRTMKQYMLDTLLITMQSTEESDVYQERLDRATRSYIGDNQFYPFAERYPEIKQLGYGPRRTK